MPKKSSKDSSDLKSAQTEPLLDTTEEDIDETVAMAAELFADLFWRHWLYMQRERRGNSESRVILACYA